MSRAHWERLNQMTMEELVTETKLRGSATILMMVTKPEGWPAAVMVVVESQRNAGVLRVIQRAQAELTTLGAPEHRAGNPELEPPVGSNLTHQMVGSLRWIAQTVHQAHHEGELGACPKATCRHIRELLEGGQ